MDPAPEPAQPAEGDALAPVGEVPVGEVPVGEVPIGEVPIGDVPAGEMRAGDLDRAQVLERLRVAHAEGRLEHAELDDRVAATLVARTYADLAALVADLPGGPPPVRPLARSEVEPWPVEPGADPAAGQAGFVRALGAAMTVAVVVAALGALVLGSSWDLAGYLALTTTAFLVTSWVAGRLRGR